MTSQDNNSLKASISSFSYCLLLLMAISHLAHAQTALPSVTSIKESNIPGGVINLKIKKLSEDLPEVKYGLHDVTIIDQKSHWQILVGVNLETLPGEYLLYVKHQLEDSIAYSHKFQVRPQSVEFISSEMRYSQIISIEHDSFSDIEFENTVQPEVPLNYPTQGHWSKDFGNIYTKGNNSESRNFIYLTTTEIATVTAPQNAIISKIIETPNKTQPQNNDTKTNYTVFLDHGRGIYSILTGVSDLTVETGNGVLAGAVLGKIHSNDITNKKPRTLIWQTVLNYAYVNPMLLTQ